MQCHKKSPSKLLRSEADSLGLRHWHNHAHAFLASNFPITFGCLLVRAPMHTNPATCIRGERRRLNCNQNHQEPDQIERDTIRTIKFPSSPHLHRPSPANSSINSYASHTHGSQQPSYFTIQLVSFCRRASTWCNRNWQLPTGLFCLPICP